MNNTIKTIDEYIANFPEDIQILLEQIRATIIEKLPEAEQCISYGMPAFKTLGKPLVYFAAFKNHIGFYATPTGHKAFANELSTYKQGKGSVQFPLNQPIPFNLIAQIVEFKHNENLSKTTKNKNPKLPNQEQVTNYLNKLDHPLKNVVEELRKIVLATDTEIGEQIKWNSLSFYYTGTMQAFDPKEYKRDIVVFNLHKKDVVLLVFPTGAKLSNNTGFLEGQFTDSRKTTSFCTLTEVKSKEKDLQTSLKEWLTKVDK